MSTYTWISHFERNRDLDPHIPWSSGYALSQAEREAVTASIQNFELGENARGRSFRARGRLYAMRSKDSYYPRALQLFIWEEQRHSAYLRRFMQGQGIPCKKATISDSIFRRMRKLADLDCMISVLLTAEIMAMSYYAALYHATESPTLKAICKRILRDEVPHLKFQGETLGKVRQYRSLPACMALELAQLLLLVGTSLVLWKECAPVFRAANMSYPRVLRRSLKFLKRTFTYARRSRAQQECLPKEGKVYARYER